MAPSSTRPRRDGPPSGPPLRGRSVGGPVPALLLACALLGAGCGPVSAPAPVVVPAAPRRIVSLAPSHTELLFALGAGDRVVGVTRFCDRPAEAAALPRVADAQSVRLEAVAGLDPDLAVVNAAALRDAMAPLGGRVPLLFVPTDTLADLLDAPLRLGRALGLPDGGRTLRATMDRDLDAARARGSARRGLRVLFVVQREPFFVAGPGSFTDALLEVLGCTNAAAGLRGTWPTVSAEALLAMAPEAIVDAGPAVTGDGDAAGADAAVRAWWARFPSLPAVRDGRVRRLRDVAAVRPGPALGAALAALEECLDAAPAAEGGR